MPYQINDIEITPSVPTAGTTTKFKPIITGSGMRNANWVTFPSDNKGGKWGGGSGMGVNVSFSMYIYNAEDI